MQNINKSFKYISLLMLVFIIAGCGKESSSSSYIHTNPTKKILQDAPQAETVFVDQYGNSHKLSEYKGKKVLINFLLSTCYPCIKEIPEFNALYADMGENKEDVVILGVMAPKSQNNKYTSEISSKAEILKFISDNDVKYPVLLDETGILFKEYGIIATPTTFTLTPNNKVYGYIGGLLNYNQMLKIIDETKD